MQIIVTTQQVTKWVVFCYVHACTCVIVQGSIAESFTKKFIIKLSSNSQYMNTLCCFIVYSTHPCFVNESVRNPFFKSLLIIHIFCQLDMLSINLACLASQTCFFGELVAVADLGIYKGGFQSKKTRPFRVIVPPISYGCVNGCLSSM